MVWISIAIEGVSSFLGPVTAGTSCVHTIARFTFFFFLTLSCFKRISFISSLSFDFLMLITNQEQKQELTSIVPGQALTPWVRGEGFASVLALCVFVWFTPDRYNGMLQWKTSNSFSIYEWTEGILWLGKNKYSTPLGARWLTQATPFLYPLWSPHVIDWSLCCIMAGWFITDTSLPLQLGATAMGQGSRKLAETKADILSTNYCVF